MDEDIIDELNKFAESPAYHHEFKALIKKTIKRIEFLRLHAGAITEGQAFEGVTKDVKKAVPFDSQ